MPGSDRPALLHWCNSARIGLPFGSLCPDRLRRGLFLSFSAFSRRSSSFPAVCLQIALYFWFLPFSQKMPLSLAGLGVSLVFLVCCTSVKKGGFFPHFSTFCRAWRLAAVPRDPSARGCFLPLGSPARSVDTTPPLLRACVLHQPLRSVFGLPRRTGKPGGCSVLPFLSRSALGSACPDPPTLTSKPCRNIRKRSGVASLL